MTNRTFGNETFAVPQRILLGPGPSNANPQVLKAMATPMIGYLDPDFLVVMDEVSSMLKVLFQSEDGIAMPISGTGSSGMEAGISSLLEPGDTVIICVHGFFGERMVDMAQRIGANVVALRSDWGHPFPPEMLENELKKHTDVKMVSIVHAETSTGILQPMDDICFLTKDYDTLLMVDAVTSLGGSQVNFSKWGADYCYSATQKCLAAPPGMSPTVLSDRGLDVVKNRSVKPVSWYLDLNLIANYWFGHVYHHTVPVSLVVGLREAIRIILDEGIQNRINRHMKNSEALRAGLEALGLELVTSPENRLDQITPIWVPDGVDEDALRNILLREFGIEIGKGLGEFAGKVLRIGLMGDSSKSELVILLLEALEQTLPRLGFEVPYRAGVSRASDLLE